MRATAPADHPVVTAANSPSGPWVGYFHYKIPPRCPDDRQPMFAYCTERPVNGVVVQRRRCSRCGRTCKTTYRIDPDFNAARDNPSS